MSLNSPQGVEMYWFAPQLDVHWVHLRSVDVVGAVDWKNPWAQVAQGWHSGSLGWLLNVEAGQLLHRRLLVVVPGTRTYMPGEQVAYEVHDSTLNVVENVLAGHVSHWRFDVGVG